MRLLAFSDVAYWKEYHFSVVERLNPEAIVLAGDIVFDGFTRLQAAALHCCSEYQRMWGRGYPLNKINRIIEQIRKSEEYENQLKVLVRKHIAEFYGFLKFACKTSPVLLIPGNHDNDYLPGYDHKKIRRLEGCFEIDGKSLEVQDLKFLGIGYDRASRLSTLKEILSKQMGKLQPVLVIVMHYAKSRIRVLSSLKPRIALVGGDGHPGEDIIDGVRTVLTHSDGHLIELYRGKSANVTVLKKDFA